MSALSWYRAPGRSFIIAIATFSGLAFARRVTQHVDKLFAVVGDRDYHFPLPISLFQSLTTTSSIIALTPFLLYGALLIMWHAAYRYVYSKNSGIPDQIHLGKPRPAGQKLQGTAVVCGGSVAGLLTAAVCASHFEKVIIVEAEKWLVEEDARRQFAWEQEHSRTRVMQYYTLQANQAASFKGLCHLFPDFAEECERSGIRVLPADFKIAFGGTPLKVPYKSLGGELPKTVFASRQGFETLLRRLVLDKSRYNNVDQLAGTVTGIVPEPEHRNRLSKVIVRNSEGEKLHIDAALVADCTGTTRAGFKWLRKAGYGSPAACPQGKLPLDKLPISLDQKLHYSSLFVNLSKSLYDRLPIPEGIENAGAVYQWAEDNPHLGRRVFAILKTDGPRLLILAGQSGDSVPNIKSIQLMTEYVHSLLPYKYRDSHPEWLYKLFELLREEEDNVQHVHLRVPATTNLRYHLAGDLPANFVAVGDSAMTSNPAYGEGCTKAQMGSLALNNILRSVKTTLPEDFASKFFKELSSKTDKSWQATRLLDYGIPYTVPIPGESPASGAAVRSYLRRLQILAIHDEQAALAVFNAAQGLGTVLDPFHPWLVMKILWDIWKRPSL